MGKPLRAVGVGWVGGATPKAGPGKTQGATESPLQGRESRKTVGRGGVGCTQAGGRKGEGAGVCNHGCVKLGIL